MSNKYERFGKYLILDHLVDGGMAKICRANFLGEQANKIVAIKMVQPQHSKNASFVQMFEDELKVTFGLLHPNIAQVYDYGMVNDQLYSAMEYIDGANLKEYLDRLKQMKFVFPVEISTYIISQVSQALFYAHTFQDKLTGTSFNIIHRDISPHNIMLAYEGAVKLIDFGIAKADSNAEATQAGTIKGKLSYLAPEYLDGLELDHRYDQFAVGITLWEMLCSRKLFSAKNDLAVLKQIQGCKIPKPSSINPNVPPELDEIVLKVLSKDRSQRYENMDKLNRALVKFLYSTYPDFNATDLSYFAKQLFKEEIASDKKKFVEFGKIDLTPYIKDLNSNQNSSSSGGSASPPPVASSGKTQADRTTKIELDLGTFDQDDNSIPSLDLDFSDKSQTKAGSRKSSQAGNSKDKQSSSDPRSTKNVKSRGKNKSGTRVSKSKRDKRESKRNSKVLPILIVASIALFIYMKPSLNKGTLAPDSSKSNREMASAVNEKSNQSGVVSFSNLEADMKVIINGEVVDFEGIEAKLEFNKDHKISISRQGYKTWDYSETVRLGPDNEFINISIGEMEESTIGFLTTSSNFSAGSTMTMLIDGVKFEKTLPLVNESMPSGSYKAVISNEVLGTKRRVRFTVEENKRNFLE